MGSRETTKLSHCPPVISLQLTVCLVVHSYVLYVVHSRFAQIDQPPQRPANVQDVVLEEFRNTLQTEPLKDEATEDTSYLNSALLLLTGNFRPCEKRRTNKWNECLGRRFTKVQCRRKSVACLSPDNLPPKCKKNYKLIRGQNGYCPVLVNCTCAA